MFTGIIQALGRISRIEPRGGDVRLHLDTGSLDLSDVAPGDSIAVSGVCLTALEPSAQGFFADVSNETLGLTTLGDAAEGEVVNLEKALRLADRLGGHLVTGHVDGLAEVTAIETDARSQRWCFRVPSGLSRYIARKGSVCIDGVSLTVNAVDGDEFEVNLIPHTQQVTTFSQRQVGDAVNIEVDLMARYAERLFEKETQA
ncbi:riboflavin synthase [Xanthomonadaceae bacterium JHOS43]|nr:riboflavin synthase [Xanthomonadaceae bacterium JHOS43]MCX7562799.1 riboflavin synthase [Xanthomonadaceae bacterium XH05]